MVGFRNLSLSAKCSEISFLHLSVFFYNFSRETLPKIMPGHKKIHYLLPIKIQNHPLFSTHPVVYMWIFGASPVAWTKSRPEWNAPEKHLQSHLGLLHPSNHNEKVQWQYMKITENHENPKQTMSSVKHFLLPKTKWIFLIEICFKEAVWSQEIHEDSISWSSRVVLAHPTWNKVF